MARGPLGGRRPGASSTLQLRIREIPVPTGDDTGVFPEPLLRAGSGDQEILDDISKRVKINSDRLSIDRTSSFTRGLGTTTVWTINVDVSGLPPLTVADMVETLSDAGYDFESAEFE